MAYRESHYEPVHRRRAAQAQAHPAAQNSSIHEGSWHEQYQPSQYLHGHQADYVNPPYAGSATSPSSQHQDYHQHHNSTGGDMAQQGQQRKPANATFYPGADDYYTAPEVVSPMPQRHMPEVPSNMQEGLANLELNARQGHRVSSQSTNSSNPSPYSDHFPQSAGPGYSNVAGHPGYTATYDHTNASAYQNIDPNAMPRGAHSSQFSPFPVPRNGGQNVPLSDEEKEEVLDRARPLVLKTTDPEMQLAWAQDALSWVEVASQSAERKEDTSRSGTPPIERQLRTDAVNIVNFLAEQSHPKAEFMKAMWLEFGKFGYPMNKTESYNGFQRAARKGYARAEYRIGMQFETSKDPAKAIQHYQMGVAMHDSAASYRLGMMTLLGQHGMQQDYHHGADMIRFAAETADENAPQGAYVYGMLLARELPNINLPEDILPYDLNDAKLFIEKAAYLGFAKAQLKMGQAYELCQLGCEFDPALSLHYNRLAARQGEPEADMAISKWFLCGYEGVFDKHEELAYTYAKRAADAKMSTAEFAMGYFYEIGMYVPKDIKVAEQWYAEAAKHGNSDALGRIDSIKKNHTFSKSDHEQVALSRIKSQYGSKRGERPAHLKQRAAQALPTMAEGRASGQPSPQGNYLPPRSASAAPYPEHEHPGPRQGGQSNRPQSDRPSSAFGVKTPGFGEPQRPYSNVNNLPVQRGRGGDPRDRVGSTPPVISPRDPSPNTYPKKPVSNANANRPYQQQPMQSPLHSPMQSPVTQTYGDARRTPVPQQQQYNNDPRRRDPAANMRPERGSSMTPGTPTSGRPMPQQTMSSRQNIPSPMSAQQNPSTWTPPPQAQGLSRPATATSAAAPKKAGPATFEEMGIPAQKKDAECVMM